MHTYAMDAGALLVIKRGDLTREATDAIVNAANPSLLGGGGVDGAIHKAAGPRLLAACERLPVHMGVRCPTGEARITPGFDLPARHVIHTVGPVYARSPDPAAELTAAYRNSLELARSQGLRSVAFPALSCGVFGYPHDEAAAIALDTVAAHADGLDEIRFVLLAASTWEAWLQAAEQRFAPT